MGDGDIDYINDAHVHEINGVEIKEYNQEDVLYQNKIRQFIWGYNSLLGFRFCICESNIYLKIGRDYE